MTVHNCDVSGGEGKDFSCAQVLKIGHGTLPTVQVARWHGYCNPSHLAKIIAALGYWYHNAEIAVEYQQAGITTANELLWSLDYPNIYRWKTLDKIAGTNTIHVHWLTNSRTREDAINRINEGLLDGNLILRDQLLIEEMRNFGRLDGESRAEGFEDTDDAVMALAITMGAMRQTIQSTADAQGQSSASHLMPKLPVILGLYNQFSQQMGQFDSEEKAVTFLQKMAKEHNGKLEKVDHTPVPPPLANPIAMTKAQAIDPAKPWAKSPIRYTLTLAGQVLTLREIMVMQANTPYSPIYDRVGAEHELHFKHGVPAREITPELVTRYREMLTARYYSGEGE